MKLVKIDVQDEEHLRLEGAEEPVPQPQENQPAVAKTQ
jgi:hypothetical protein